MLASPELPARADVRLRRCISAGEPLPKDIGERFAARFGCDVLDGIGSTEMLHIFLSNHAGDVRYGTTGTPVPGYDVELRGEDGAPVRDGEIGDLYIRGPSAALMYWANREQTRATFQGAWTKSGDKYVRDADGYYTYCGAQRRHAEGRRAVRVAVRGRGGADAPRRRARGGGRRQGWRTGSRRRVAFVVLKPGHAGDAAMADALKAFVKDRLAPYKYPREIRFESELPKTATGKIQRFRLRERAAG